MPLLTVEETSLYTACIIPVQPAVRSGWDRILWKMKTICITSGKPIPCFRDPFACCSRPATPKAVSRRGRMPMARSRTRPSHCGWILRLKPARPLPMDPASLSRPSALWMTERRKMSRASPSGQQTVWRQAKETVCLPPGTKPGRRRSMRPIRPGMLPRRLKPAWSFVSVPSPG